MAVEGWQPIRTAPFDQDLELAVIEGSETHALAVRSRRTLHGWINAVSGKAIDVDPTHWRVWRTDD
jgi:hypothetical protein